MTDQQQLKALIKSSKGPEEKEKMGPVSTKQHRVFQNFPFSGSFIVSFSTMDIAFFFPFWVVLHIYIQQHIFLFNEIYLYSSFYICIQQYAFSFNFDRKCFYSPKIFVLFKPKIISFNKKICSTSTKNNG